MGYCLADVKCGKLKGCSVNSDCGEGAKCMVTCCAEKKCLEIAFLCTNPGAPAEIFAMKNFESLGEESTNGIGGVARREWRA